MRRITPPTLPDGERESRESWLDFHRATLLLECQGQSAAQLVVASCPPSDLTLIGLVRHLVGVENWFTGSMTSRSSTRIPARTPSCRNLTTSPVTSGPIGLPSSGRGVRSPGAHLKTSLTCPTGWATTSQGHPSDLPTLGTRSGRRPSASRRTSTRIQKKKDASAVPEAVTGGQGVTRNGSVGFWVDGQQVGTVPLAADGMASKVVGPFASGCTRTVGVPYSGDMVTTARTGTTTITVTNGNPK